MSKEKMKSHLLSSGPSSLLFFLGTVFQSARQMIDLKESTTKIHMISVETPDLQTAKKRPEPSLAGITNPRSVSLWLSQTFPHGQGSFEIKLCFRTSISKKDWLHERMTSCPGCSLWRGALKVYSFPLTFSRHEGPVPQRFWWINKKHLLTSNSLYKNKGRTWGFPSPWSQKNMPASVSPVFDSQRVSFFCLSFPNSDLCKETPETHSGSPHSERTYPSAFTHLKISLSHVFPSVVCVAQYYFLFHVVLLFPWCISLFVYWIILWTRFCFFSETSKLFFLC